MTSKKEKALCTDSSNSADSATVNVGVCHSKRVHRSLRVDPERWERLKEISRELGASSCEVLEGLIDALDAGFKKRVESLKICKDVYLFIDLHLHREVKRVRRYVKGSRIEERVEAVEQLETRGSMQQCGLCPVGSSRPVKHLVHEPRRVRGEAPQLVTWYFCDVHFQASGRKILKTVREAGHKRL